ncbi:hypothetical protein ACHAW6_005361 [Cyclotella cf. meneghiniana]
MNTIDTAEDDHTMSVIPIASSDDEYDLREHAPDDDLDSDYGEIEVGKAPRHRSRSSRLLSPNFYKQAVRRQNFFFGISLIHIVAAFIAAYFLMGMSFTRSNIAIFGDEVAMEGSSGEVGIDAENAEVQAIIDEEIVELEEAGNWGDNAKTIDATQRFKDLIKNRDKVGMNNWTEQKQWWLENKDHLDESQMTEREKKIANRLKQKEYRQKMIQERKKKEREKARDKRKNNKANGKGQNEAQAAAAADATDLDLITEKLSKHYNFTDAQSGRPWNKIKGHGGRNKEHRPGNSRQKGNHPGTTNNEKQVSMNP